VLIEVKVQFRVLVMQEARQLVQLNLQCCHVRKVLASQASPEHQMAK
jgi:hypothetical protein